MANPAPAGPLRAAAAPLRDDLGEIGRDLEGLFVDRDFLDAGHLHRAGVLGRALRVLTDGTGRGELHDGALLELLVEREHLGPFAAQRVRKLAPRLSDAGE